MFNLTVSCLVSDAHSGGPELRRSRRLLRSGLASAAVRVALLAAGPALAGPAEIDATYKDVEQTLGSVPSFLRQVSKAALPGAWAEVKALQFSGETAASTRHWSTIFHGMQVDFETFRKELGGDAQAVKPAR